MNAVYAGVETGGTKIIVGLAGSDGSGGVAGLITEQFPTGDDPGAAIARAVGFVAGRTDRLAGLGIGTFGPCVVNPASPGYGSITTTPKPGWRGTDLLGLFDAQLSAAGVGLDAPIAFETDVNAALLAEVRWGAGRGLTDVAYVTIGTGIGMGAMVAGTLVHGLVHPESGHMRIPRDPEELPGFMGRCPAHADCWEGFAAGPTIAARWGSPAQELPRDHPAWQLEARYLAKGLHNIAVVLSPQRIIVGGGVGSLDWLRAEVHRELRASLNGYVDHDALGAGIADYVVGPGLGDRAGVLGSLALAGL